MKKWIKKIRYRYIYIHIYIPFSLYYIYPIIYIYICILLAIKLNYTGFIKRYGIGHCHVRRTKPHLDKHYIFSYAEQYTFIQVTMHWWNGSTPACLGPLITWSYLKLIQEITIAICPASHSRDI